MKVYDSYVSALDLVYTRMEEDKKDLRNDGLLLHKNFIVRFKVYLLALHGYSITVCQYLYL